MTQLFALTGIVILVAALASGAFERRGVSLVLLFLTVGLLIGPYGLGLATFELTSPRLQLVATLSLIMVLFSDAVSLQPRDLRANAGLAALILGPGTLAAAVIIALAAWKLLAFSGAGAAMLGAALASTDPVLLRAVLRNPRVPAPVRHALRLESGMNDAVLLPIVLIAMAVAGGHTSSPAMLAATLSKLLVLGPLAGGVVGLVCVLLMSAVRKRYGMRRDYESLYTIGVGLTAFAVAEMFHTSGYLAAFSAGLAIAFMDVELCDCFHDYGEATAEAALLFTFVALGGSLIWMGLAQVDVAHVLFVVIALATRPLVLLAVVHHHQVERRRDRMMLAWFGPRGLSSLLLILLPVFAGLPEGPDLFAVCSLVVLASVLIHGASPALLAREASEPQAPDNIRITIAELNHLIATGEEVHILDVRTAASFDADVRMAAQAIRVNPDYVVEEVRRLGLPRDAWLALYCT